MNQLKNSIPTKIYETFKVSNKLELPTPYNKDLTLFIRHSLALIAKIKLVSSIKHPTLISVKRTLMAIPQEGIFHNDAQFTHAEMVSIIKLLAEVPRSWFVKDNRKNPQFASLTPLFMYAFKLYPPTEGKPIGYQHWDTTDEWIDIALGSFLNKAWEFQKDYKGIDLIVEAGLRASLLGSKKLGDYQAQLSYTERSDDTEEVGEVTVYPKEWLHMHLQFWLAHAERRVPEAMLLDIKHWGVVPKTLDAIPIATQERQEFKYSFR